MKSKIHKNLLELNNKAMRKSLKINSLKKAINISLIVILFTSACAQSGKDSNTAMTNNTATKTAVSQPKIDIHSAVISGSRFVFEKQRWRNCFTFCFFLWSYRNCAAAY